LRWQTYLLNILAIKIMTSVMITTTIKPVHTPAWKISAIALQPVKTVDSKIRSNRFKLYFFFMEIQF
jgi:hypothetical protein